MSEPDYPIFEMHTDEHGNPSVRISDKVTLLTKEQSEQVLERFKNLVTENAELRKLAEDIYWDYVTDDAICDGSKLPHYKKRMHKLGIEVPE